MNYLTPKKSNFTWTLFDFAQKNRAPLDRKGGAAHDCTLATTEPPC
jgi:hypothetical protein